MSLGNQFGEGALMKLGGLGSEIATPIASLPLVPALATLFEAFRQRAVVTFTHRGNARTVEPWGLSSKRGHWYVVGWDRDRGAIRAFRADRIEGDVERRRARRVRRRRPTSGPTTTSKTARGCSATTTR